MRISDWSSDVCSSDLPVQPAPGVRVQREARRRLGHQRIAQCQQRDVFEDVGVVAGVEGVAVVHGIGGWDPGAGGWGKPSVSSGWRGKLSTVERNDAVHGDLQASTLVAISNAMGNRSTGHGFLVTL